MNKDYIHVEGVELPSGSIYEGEALEGMYSIEITGKGKSHHKDGSEYEGQFKYGIPFGFGTYIFPDGDYHVGFFDDLPNGPGYLCLNSQKGMSLGHYKNGKLHGWAIGIKHGLFNCSFLQSGKVVKDYTSEFEWMKDFLEWTIFETYKGNMIQKSPDLGYIRYGAPNRTAQKFGIKFRKLGVGFLFSTDGCMYVGQFYEYNNLNGWAIKCMPNGEYLGGLWKDNVLVKSENSFKEIKAAISLEYSIAHIRNVIDSGC
jgi:hypothetical protein